jgi:predicted DNA-binding transcriptional regulator AlpA
MPIDRLYSPDWLDDQGAAYCLSLPVSTFREYVAAGMLPEPTKIGKHTRWSREALNSRLEEIGQPSKSEKLRKAFRRATDGQETEGRDHAS